MTLAKLVSARDDQSPAHSVSSVNRRKFVMNTAVSVVSLASATTIAAPAPTGRTLSYWNSASNLRPPSKNGLPNARLIDGGVMSMRQRVGVLASRGLILKACRPKK
jgi:hypothetical protein